MSASREEIDRVMAACTWRKRIVATLTSVALAIGTSCGEGASGDAGDSEDEEALDFRAGGPDPAAGKQIHEIHPVKFGGSPTDLSNKIALTPAQHQAYTNFWNRLQKDIE